MPTLLYPALRCPVFLVCTCRVYVEQVERELMWALDQMMKEETWQPLSADLPVLKSSNELVEALKKEMRDCVSRVTRGRALLDLAAVFGRVYRIYAARLLARLPKTASGQTTVAATLGTTDWHVRIGEEDISLVCLIISTAEHCQEMVRQLARAVAGRLDPPELGARLDMGDEEGEFQSVITQCLGVLLLGIETRLEAGLAGMLRVSWGGVEVAGDQSEYVGAFRRALVESGARLGAALPANYFHFFCDKLLRSFAPRLHEAVFRCRKISDVGCQQMRLDTEVVKTLLSDLAREGGKLDAGSQQAFAAEVSLQLGRAEAVLKVVGSPPEAMVETFFELLPNGSPSDFQRMAELKVGRAGRRARVAEHAGRRAPGQRPMHSVCLAVGRAAGLRQGCTVGIQWARRRQVLASSQTGCPVLTPQPPMLLPPLQVMRRQEYQEVLAQFNRRMGRPVLSGQATTTPTRQVATSFKMPPATTAAAAKASAAAQDMASRFKMSANVQAARASATAASESVRETMKHTLGAMKGLRFGMPREAQQ